VQINVPVRVGGVTIHPGDLLHGDRNGVTTIPTEIAAKVAAGCADFVAAEAIVLDYLRTSKVDPPGYAEARQQCQRRIGELSKRLKERL
jgi:regulator of RNase E activity RraA